MRVSQRALIPEPPIFSLCDSSSQAPANTPLTPPSAMAVEGHVSEIYKQAVLTLGRADPRPLRDTKYDLNKNGILGVAFKSMTDEEDALSAWIQNSGGNPQGPRVVQVAKMQRSAELAVQNASGATNTLWLKE